MTIRELYDLIQSGGVVMLLIFAVIAFVRGYVVPIWLFNMVLREREEYRKEAWEATRATERAADVAARIAATRPAGES